MSGLVILNLITILGLATAFAAVPLIARREFLFGLTLPPGFRQSAAGRRVIRNYVAKIALAGFGCAALAVAALLRLPIVWAVSCTLVLNLAILLLGMIIYARAHGLLQTLVTTPAVTAQATPLPHLPISAYFPRPHSLLLAPYGLLAAAALILLVRHAALRARLPIRFDIAGHATAFVSATGAHIALFLLIGTSAVLGGQAMMFIALRLRKRPSTAGRTRPVNTALLIAVLLIGLLFSFLAAAPAFLTPREEGTVFVFSTPALIVIALATVAVTTIVGLRQTHQTQPAISERSERTPDE